MYIFYYIYIYIHICISCICRPPLPPHNNVLDMDLSETYYWHCFDSIPASVRQANHVSIYNNNNMKIYNAYWAPRENNVFNNNNYF